MTPAWYELYLPRKGEDQSEVTYMAMTVWGEARSSPAGGKVAVAEVIYNRMRYSRKTAKATVTAPHQFSCWNPTDPNLEKMWEPLKHDSETVWEQCVWVALGILNDWFPHIGANRVYGLARHYVASSLPIAERPPWVKARPDYSVGGHDFYEGVA